MAMLRCKRQQFFSVLAVLWMVVIFLFSARNADLSTEDSHRAGMAVGRILYRDFEEWSEPRQVSFAVRIDHPVRKAAHASEYAVLALLLLGAFLPGERKRTGPETGQRSRGRGSRQPAFPPELRRAAGYALACCFLYACTDEVHQMFVPGRSGKPTDVLIDCTGAFAALLAAVFVCSHIGKK